MNQFTSEKRAVVIAVTVTQFAIPFMLSAVGVALPAIGREFQAHGVALSMVETIFLGVSAMCLIAFGRASDLTGRRWMFLLGLAILASSSIALGFTWNIEMLIAIRAIQAIGGSMQLASGLAILIEYFPPNERGKALGIAITGVFLGISAGPFLGGVITNVWGWRWVFFLGAVPCIVALLLSLRVLKWDFQRSEKPFDWTGTVLSIVCVGLFMLGGANMDKPFGLPSLGVACLALMLFLFVESRKKDPLLDLHMFRGNPQFSTGNLFQLLNASATFGVAFLMSLYLQIGHGMSPGQAGGILVIQPIAQTILSPFCGRLADRYPPGFLATAGLFIGAVGVGWASTFDAGTSMLSVMLMLVILGVGIALFAAPNMNLIMSSVPPRQFGLASAIAGQMRTIGMTIGMVAITMAISFLVGDRVLDAAAFPDFHRAMQMILSGFCVIGALASVFSLFVSIREFNTKSLIQSVVPVEEHVDEIPTVQKRR